MDSSRRRLVAWTVICFLVGATGIVVAAHIAGTVPVSDGVSLQAPDGMNATLTGNTDALLETPFPTSGTVEWTTEAGNISFFSSGAAAATIHTSNITGTWTNVTHLDADPNTITITPGDKAQVVVGQEIDSIAWKDTNNVGVDDGVVDFVYAGTTGQSRVTIQGVPANTEIGAVDADTGVLLDNASSTGSGAVTFDALTNSEHAVLLQTGEAPTLSNADPTGDLSNPPSQLSIDVNDTDFPGDDVTVEFTLDGTVVGTQTTSTNGTVSQSISNPSGGSHTWNVTVNDSYDNTVQSSDFTFRVPANLTVREETPPYEIIDHKSIESTCYENVDTNPEIRNQTTTNGKIDLTGFPTGTEFSCAFSVPGYHNRTVILESLYEQNNVFLINRTANITTIENRFTVSDRTGEFPNDETEIIIQAAINTSIYESPGDFQWLAVAGDDLGADEAFTTDLIEEDRYRILVRDNDNNTRVLGAYTAETTGTIDLTIGSVVIDPEAPETVGLNASWQNATGSNPTVRVSYNDSTQNTTAIHLTIYEYQNQSNVLLANTTFNGPFGTFSQTETVPNGENDTTWVVKLVAERPGDNIVIEQPVGPGAPVLGDMPAYLVTILYVGSILMVAGLFSQLNGDFGGLIVAGLGGIFYFLNLVPSYLGTGVVVLSFIAAGVLFIRERGSGGL